MDSDVLQSTLDDLSYLVIPPSHLTFESDVELGCGGYGEVYLALLTRSIDTPPQRVAVKQLRIVQAKEVRRRIAIRLVRELKVWAASKHPNILELVGFYLAENHGCAQFVSAYMAHGNVKDYIKVHQPTVAVRLNFVQGITSGINYLHNCDPSICHGDLKPSNVLVNDNIEAVLCDFGLATFIETSGVSSGLTTSISVKGSTRYMSPELLQDTGATHTLGSDVWAWACTAFEVLTNYRPYHTAMGDVSVMKALVLGKCPGSVEMISDVAPDNDPACHRVLDPLKCVITECWASDPENRPSSSEIMSRLFFQRDTKPSDALPAPREPPSSDPIRTVEFVVIDDETGDDFVLAEGEDEPEERPSSSEIKTDAFLQCDTKPSDAPSAPSGTPSSSKPIGTFEFIDDNTGEELVLTEEEDELEADQNSGRLALPTEPGSRDSYFTLSPTSQGPQIGADGERGSGTSKPSEDGGDDLFTVSPLRHPRNGEDRQEPMAQPFFLPGISGLNILNHLGPRDPLLKNDLKGPEPLSIVLPPHPNNPPPPPRLNRVGSRLHPTPIGFPAGSLDVGHSLPASAVVKGSERFICQWPACGKVCKSSGGLTRHCRTHMVKLYSCKECGKRFYSPGDLARHRQLHKKVEARKSRAVNFFSPTPPKYSAPTPPRIQHSPPPRIQRAPSPESRTTVL